MNIKIISTLLFALFNVSVMAETLTYPQVLQRVIEHYPSIKIAAYQITRAQQENRRVDSQLGWQFNAKAGISRNVSAFGSLSDNLSASADMSRKLSGGASLGVSALISRDDAETVLSPTLANPLTSSSVNLNYRQPLQKGLDNPTYSVGLASAKVAVEIAKAEHRANYDQLAAQVAELYLAAATIQLKIKNLEQSIVRSRRLKKYISDRLELGVSEEKDILQVEAQIKSQQAEREGLLMVWQKQKISLNRLMGVPWHTKFLPAVNHAMSALSESALMQQAIKHSAALGIVQAKLQLNENTIELKRDAKKDNLDLLMFVGNKTSEGDTATGNISDSELVAGVSIEFNRGFSRQAYDAELYQAQIDKGISLENKRQLLEDLQYDISSLLAELSAGKKALSAYKRSASSEKKKLDEAEVRYKKGRADTDQLIQFESQLSLSEVAVDLQNIELIRRFYTLDILRGEIWKSINVANVNLQFK